MFSFIINVLWKFTSAFLRSEVVSHDYGLRPFLLTIDYQNNE